ncbi:MSCRAMM family protein [Lapidilactobacillus wuchangensis]|uniref:MSCRAMM family protein n=1 Tax=Lapidilactobacillus wuchangensis TaxID=2486001 RepID=UPI000F79D9E6|nr:SpaA isopeptide-forming pilin-related protein [Lapidilactobacillus wuchangensis]
MKIRIKSILMTLLVLLQVAVAPLSVVNAQTSTAGSQASAAASTAPSNVGNTEAASTADSDNPTGQIQFANEAQKNLDPLRSDQNYTINLSTFVNANAGSQAAKLSGGTITVLLPKDHFVAPQTNDLTNQSQYIDHVEISDADATNYQIIYHLKTMDAQQAATINIPYTTHFTGPYTAGLKVNLVQTITDKNGVELNRVSAPISINTVQRSFTLAVKVYQDISSTQVSAGRLKADYPFFIWLSDNQRNYNDLTPITVTVDVPTGLNFDAASAKNSDWTYDESTRKATLVFAPDSDLSINNTRLHLPLIIPQGTQTTVSGSNHKFDFKYSIEYSNGTILPGDRDTEMVVRQEQPWYEQAKMTSKFYRSGEQSADVKQVDDKTLIYSTLQFLANERDSDSASKTVKVSSAQFDWNTTNFKGYGLSLAGPTDVALTHNTVYGLQADGTKVVVAKNISNNVTVIDPAKTADFSSLYIQFDDPVLMTSPDTGINIYQYFQSTELQRCLKNDQYGQYYGLSGTAYYSSSNSHSNSRGNINLTKHIPTINTRRGELLPTTLLKSGNTVNAKFQYEYEGLTQPIKLQNAYVYYLLPLGLAYHETATDQAVGMTDIKVIPNFKNTGKTAVVGKVADPLMQLNGTETYGYKNFSLPITATSSLRTSKNILIENYLIFKNNDGTFDQTLPNMDQAVYTAASADPYGLATDSDRPNNALREADNDLAYTAPDALTSIALVKNQDSQEYVPDLGNAGDIGDQLSYRFDLISNNTADSTKVGIINVLPTKGENGSQFSVRMTGPATITSAAGITHDYSDDFDIYYSTDQSTTIKQDYQTATWSKSVSDYSKVRMVKAVLKPGLVLSASDEINLDYTAQIPNDSSIPDQSKIYNSFQMTFDNGNNFGNAIASAASINYKTSGVEVTKIAGDTGQPLAKVQFKLFDYQTDQQLNTDTVYATNNEGKLSISGLKPGHYYLRETTVPTGYVTPNTATEKQANQFVIQHNQAAPTQLTITNIPQKSLLIQKTDELTKQPLAQAHFQVVAADGQKVQKDLVTDDQGQAYAYSLVPGTYTIKETVAPTGYQLAADQTVTIAANSELITADVTDRPISGMVQLTDSAQQTGQPIVGSHFNLYQLQAGREILVASDLTTDQQGQFSQKSLLIGQYRLKQMTVPTMYQLNKNNFDFAITATKTQADIQVQNARVLVAPDQPQQPNVPNQPSNQSDNHGQGAVSNQASIIKASREQAKRQRQSFNKLPQANEQTDLRVRVIGLMLLLLLGTPIVFRRLTD